MVHTIPETREAERSYSKTNGCHVSSLFLQTVTFTSPPDSLVFFFLMLNCHILTDAISKPVIICLGLLSVIYKRIDRLCQIHFSHMNKVVT